MSRGLLSGDDESAGYVDQCGPPIITVSLVKSEAIKGESSTPVIELESNTTPIIPSGFGLCPWPGGKKIESVVRGTRYPNPAGCIVSAAAGNTKFTTPTLVEGLCRKWGSP